MTLATSNEKQDADIEHRSGAASGETQASTRRDVPRLGILAKGDANWIGGMHYTINLIRALHALPDSERVHLTLLVPSGTSPGAFAEIESLVDICTIPPHQSDQSSPRMNPALLTAIADRDIDLVFPCMRSMGEGFPIPWLAWIPDLQHVTYPQFFTESQRSRRDEVFTRLAEDAKRIVVSSHCARTDCERAYPACRGKLRVLRFACVPDERWFEDKPAAVVERYDLPDRFLMLPNQFWIHKNHRTAFEAIERLAHRGVKLTLVCTGSTDDLRHPEHIQGLRQFIESVGLHDSIRILGLIPRCDQMQLLRAATAVVQPSLFEGWSTAVEDARALGKTLFLSDIPVHREQNPPRATYFDPESSEMLADVIEGAWARIPEPDQESRFEQARIAHRRHVIAFGRTFRELVCEAISGSRSALTGHSNPSGGPRDLATQP